MKPSTGCDGQKTPSRPWEEQVSTKTALELRRQQVLNLREKLEHGAETARKLAGVELLCRTFDGGRGIWKQIDENRQLLQFLFDEFPEVKERAFFIENWVGDTDYFLNCLAELLDLKEPSPTQFFPRPWPGKGCDPRVGASSRAASIKKTFVGKHEENSDGNRLS